MSKVRLTGSNSGYVEISAAADAGNLTFTMPTSGTALLGNNNNVFSGITTTGQLDINGSIDVSSTSVFNDDVTFTGGSYNVLWDKSDNALEFADNAVIKIGSSGDLELFHDGNNSYIKEVGNGALLIRGSEIQLQSVSGEQMIGAFTDGGVTLRSDNVVRLTTTNTGVVVTGICTATSFSGSGENLTRTTQLSHRNIIINGAMKVAQRATTSTSDGIKTVDRFGIGFATGAIQQDQITLTSSDTPYAYGFRKSYRLTNTTASTAVTAARDIRYQIEAQDIATSGWDSTSSSSKITLSFWIKASVSQTYYVFHYVPDSQKNYNWNFTPVANTWTKITQTIPGASGVTINDDNGPGMSIQIVAYYGNNFTASTDPTQNQWFAWSGTNRIPNMTNTWGGTTNATFEVTGMQLEVGQQATPFEHRRYDDQLFACQRYYCELGRRINFDGSAATGDSKYSFIGLQAYTTSNLFGTLANFPRKMRAKPTVTTIGHVKYSNKSGGNIFAPNASTYTAITHETVGTHGIAFSSSLFTQGGFACGFTDNDNANYNYIKADAEL